MNKLLAAGVALILSSMVVAQEQPVENDESEDVLSESVPSLEFLEYLGFENAEGEWLDPTEFDEPVDNPDTDDTQTQ